MAVLSSWGPGGALRRRCLPHTGTLQAWAPSQLGCRCALSSQGPRSPGHLQVLCSTWRPCLPAFVQRSAHHQRRRGCPDPPRCQEDNCGISLPGSSRRCLPRGEDRRDTGVPLTFSGEESLRSNGCAGENRRAHSLASDSWQLQQLCHQNFPGAESHSRVFLVPPRSLFPAKTRFTANSRKSALQKCTLPCPPSPPPGLGSLPKVGARSGASCPIPGSGVLGRGAANSPW